MSRYNVCVYILRCADGSYYVGKYQGDEIESRVAEHNAAHYPHAYTARRRPVILVWNEWMDRYDDAVALERRLNGWSRKKKEAFIAGDFGSVQRYARRGFKPSSDPS